MIAVANYQKPISVELVRLPSPRGTRKVILTFVFLKELEEIRDPSAFDVWAASLDDILVIEGLNIVIYEKRESCDYLLLACPDISEPVHIHIWEPGEKELHLYGQELMEALLILKDKANLLF